MHPDTDTLERDPTSGIDPLFATMPVVVAEGREYPLRRLGPVDMMAVMNILSRSAPAALARGADLTPESVVMYLVMAMPSHEREVTSLIASILQVKPDEFRDPARFPLGCVPDIMAAIATHPDVDAFVKNAERRLADPNVKAVTARLAMKPPSSSSNGS